MILEGKPVEANQLTEKEIPVDWINLARPGLEFSSISQKQGASEKASVKLFKAYEPNELFKGTV